MVLQREVTADDIGLKVLREPPGAEIDIVAVHTHQAHPDDTWRKNTGSQKLPQYKNWLQDILPAIVPNARIMRYGYQSQWFGTGAIRLGVRTVALRLLLALRRRRREAPSRTLIFIAHGYGGLVVLKALVEARDYPSDGESIFSSVKGLLFLGTPFGGVEGYVQKLQQVQENRAEGTVYLQGLEILRPGDEFLVDLVEGFNRREPKALIACVYQSFDEPVKGGFMVDESSGCLETCSMRIADSRTHVNMNKFGDSDEPEFRKIQAAIKRMVDPKSLNTCE